MSLPRREIRGIPEAGPIEMLRTLLNNLDAFVYRCRGDESRSFEYVSDGCLALAGIAVEELLLHGRARFDSIIHRDDRDGVRAAIEAALATRSRFEVEYRLVFAGNETRWVWERGRAFRPAAGDASEGGFEGVIEDISERKQTEQSLRDAERRFHDLFDHAIEGIFRTTPEGIYLDANPSLARIYGFDSPEELIRTLRNIDRQLYVDPRRRSEFMSVIKARGTITDFESQVFRKNGEVIWISENARAVLDDRGEVRWYEGSVEDITERRRYQAQIERQAKYDALTGVANRALLGDRLAHDIHAAATYGTRLAVVLIDVDHFKLINDSLGHHRGDSLLRTLADRLQSCVRECDTVARLGGDEFVLLLNGQMDPGWISELMERMREVVSRPWESADGRYEVTCSAGIALYPDDGADADTLLRHADAAMYRAKEEGRNNAQFFTAEINTRMRERLELSIALKRAIENEELELHYQPRVHLASGEVVACEALARWRLPGRGMIPPDRFIPLAEESGQIRQLGRWVLREACRQNQKWRDLGLKPMVVSVNVSPHQFRQERFVEDIESALAESGLEPSQLEIEITENMVVRDEEHMIDSLERIKSLGVAIAIDDFGTGYSNLGYLHRFPIDRLKLDRSFVRDLGTSLDDTTVIRAIIALGHNLGLSVTAEGVETERQLELLAQHACDEIQGYCFARPMPGSEIAAFLELPASSRRRSRA
jgi:diguanylate cyclase (GGDEF)-like protein/PAS domain S-box-containing protein